MEPSEGNRIIEHLRSMDERDVHVQVIQPLLEAMGATHIRYVHGPAEHGRDFIYMVPGFYGSNRLSVCQVKNSPFTGNSSKTSNTIAVLNQLVQCRSCRVLNPETKLQEMPDQVVLFTTYPLPDKDLLSATPLLDQIRASACEVVTPEQLVQLIRTNLPTLYNEIANPGASIQQALSEYLKQYGEAVAFDLSSDRSRFFVSLGVANASNLTDVIYGMAPHSLSRSVRGTEGARNLLSRAKDIISPTAAKIGIIEKATDTLRLDGPSLHSLIRSVKEDLDSLLSEGRSAKAESVASAIEMLDRTAKFLDQLIEYFGIDLPDPLTASRDFEVPYLNPDPLLQIKANILLVGGAGAGKTSLCRAVALSAISRGEPCIYFPCQNIDASNVALEEAIVAFLEALSPRITEEMAREAVSAARVFIIDGCDEAATFGPNLGQQMLRLAIRQPLVATVDRSAKAKVAIPQELRGAVTWSNRRRQLAITRPIRLHEFDKLRDANISQSSLDAIDRLEAAYRTTVPMIITSARESAQLELGPTFTSLELMPFNDSQLEEFFRTWFRTDADSGAEILDFLNENHRIKDICRVPIAATIVASLKENKFDLPQSRTEVYEKYFDLMLEKWDRSKMVPVRNKVKTADKRKLLRKLAWIMHTKHRRLFTIGDVETLWNIRLADLYDGIGARDVVRELQLVNSVVVPVTRHEYSLGHLSFQEFLAAEAAVFGGRMEHLVDRFVDPWWQQTCIFYAGKCGDVDAFLARVQVKHGVTSGLSQMFSDVLDEARFTPRTTRAVIRDLLSEDEWRDPGDDD